MAKAKRKRRSKHRGTQAGTVEARGRTSRPRSRDEARRQALQRREQQRLQRAAQPPSWRGAAIRAAFAAGAFLLLLLVFGQKPASAILVSVAAFGFYVVAGYYLDALLYRMRQRREARQRQATGSDGRRNGRPERD